ncbi:hypothetical protein SY88_11665 [Clostridiales bacterium PH28_bin88]|nr:hypothetical protein SY88_11665 [Clostridiales bacterium PH28_bin88]
MALDLIERNENYLKAHFITLRSQWRYYFIMVKAASKGNTGKVSKGKKTVGATPDSAPEKTGVKHAASGSVKGNPIFYEIAFFGLALLMFYPPYFRGLFFPPEQEWTLIVASVLFFVTWLWKLSRREVSFLARPVDWLAVGLAVLYWLAVFWAANKRLAVDGAVKASIYFLVFWLVSQLARDSRRADVLINVIYLSAVGVAAAGFLTAVGVVHIKDGFVGGRIFSTMQYPNTLASYLGAVSLLGFYLWGKASTPWRFPYAVGNYILLLIFIATGSRGGYLVYPLAVILLFALTPRVYWGYLAAHMALTALAAVIGNYKMLPSILAKNMAGAWTWVGLGAAAALVGQALLLLVRLLIERVKFGKIIVAIGLVAVFVAGIAVTGSRIDLKAEGTLAQKVLPKQVLARIQDISLETKSSQDRIYWTKDALRILKQNPVVGLGGGAWEATYRSYQGYQYNSTQVHNDWVQLWLEVGTIGLLLFIGVWLLTLYTGWRNYRRGSPSERLRQGAVLAAMVSLGAHAFIDFDLALSSVAILLWALFGLTRAEQRTTEPAGTALPARQFFSSRWGYLGGTAAASLLLVIVAGTLLAGNSYARKGITELNNNNLGQSIAMFEKARVYDRFSASYLADLGKFYAAQGKRDKAMQLIDQAISKDRMNWKMPAIKAEIVFNNREPEQGMALLEEARDLAPWLDDPWENLAWAYTISGINSLAGGDAGKAKDYLRKAAALPGEMAGRATNLGETEKKLWPGWKSFQNAPRVQLSAGISNYFLNQWKEAEAQLSAASKNQTTKGDALLWLSLLREKQGKTEEAKKFFQQSIEAGSTMVKEFENLKKLPVIP